MPSTQPSLSELTSWTINTYDNEEVFQWKAISMISKYFPKLRHKVFHVQNEQHIPKLPKETPDQYKLRCLKIGNMNKAKGKLAGVMDILILHNGILYKIELKQPDGVLTESQQELHPIWDEDQPKIPVVVAYCLATVYHYCKWIIEQNLKIAFPNEYTRFEYRS